MSSYEALAGSYDALTTDVGYRKRADYLEKLFQTSRIPVHTVLDLACGTGTLTCLLAERGYELIGADGSEDMLAVAQQKAWEVEGERPIFLHQSMQKLDLYGTVDAAVCCLDSLNYLTSPKDLQRTLARLHLFIAPGGLFVFDVNSVYKLERLAGQVFLDETEDVFCVWRTEYAPRTKIVQYGMDIFQRQKDGRWCRSREEHRERAYGEDELRSYLTAAGFGHIHVYGDLKKTPPKPDEARLIFTCIRE
ncbi:MAG: class I SAM-dependent methyltransferase [Oscillospiraceae bacterium]